MQELFSSRQKSPDLSQPKDLLPWVRNHFRLWSLEDMLKITAQQYISIGQYLSGINHLLTNLDDNPLVGKMLDDIRTFFLTLKKECDLVNLKLSSSVLATNINRLSPQARALDTKTTRGMVIALMDMINEEFKSQLFLYILPHHVVYYEWSNTFSEQLTTAFPKASRDLFHAGNCFAMEEYTACVFHSMCAMEIGLRALASYLQIELPRPLNTMDWQNLIDKIEQSIKDEQQKKWYDGKDDKLTFCSNAAALFRYFKEAYRKHVAHARANYEEQQAESIMVRTREFLESLTNKLSEIEKED